MTDPPNLANWHTPENARRYRAYTESFTSYDEWSDRLVELAQIRPGMSVLDLGCDTGATTDALLRRHGDTIDVIAVDKSEAQLAQAREHSCAPNVRYLHCDAERSSM